MQICASLEFSELHHFGMQELNFAPENDLIIKFIYQQFNSKMESGYIKHQM